MIAVFGNRATHMSLEFSQELLRREMVTHERSHFINPSANR